MIFKTLKAITLAFTLLAGVVASLTTEAATVSGTLGTSIVAADSYAFTCPTVTAKVQINVMDLNTIRNSLATVYATIGKDGSPTSTVADTESTPTGSAPATNTDGQGIYSLVVNKSTTGTEDYTVQLLCLNSLGKPLTLANPQIKTNQ
ncbi:hypothetical protein [Methyloglobulus sp.]|uniref:hypothetical protein n=1 Tax=Methyloglobulus sp. TaxID=2518622 RepID=UPI0032B74421